MTFNELTLMRIKRRLTQKEAARLLQCSGSWLSLIEQGASNPGPKLMRNMAALYDVPVERIQVIMQSIHRKRSRGKARHEKVS